MDIAVRLLLAIPLAMFLGWFVVFVFSLITGVVNLVVFGIAKAIRSVLGLAGSSAQVGAIGYEVIDLTKALMGFCLTLAIGWLAFVSFALERGPDLYTVFSTVAAALALFIWAPTLFFVGLLTGEEREATGRGRGGRSVRSVVVGLAVVAVISFAAYALLRGGGDSNNESATAGDATSAATVTSTPRPCDDETAASTLRASVVRISTDSGAVGTGIIVGDNRVLTNAHVVEGASTVRVESQ